MKPRFFIAVILAFLGLAASRPALAFAAKDTYPKLANYYLQPNVPYGHFEALARYDLVVLDVDTQTIDPSLFATLKKINPGIKTFAYIPSQSVNVEDLGSWARFRKMTFAEADAKDRWLKDDRGNFVYFSSTWPTIRFVDIGNGWSDYLSDLAARDVVARGVWDGVFYDMVFYNLNWLNGGNIDLDRDGAKDDSSTVNRYWQTHSENLLKKTREKTGTPVVANVDIVGKYDENLDGVMMENFPAGWLGPNGWSILENNYLNGSNSGKRKVIIINANTANVKNMSSYKKMRFGLTSTLLGDGYFSFDSGDQDHAQTWWYDEYDVDLGRAAGRAYNLLDRSSTAVKAGLWRRDFENGVAIVNSTVTEQKYVFLKEQFEKISGKQDRGVNNGSKVNWVKLAAGDGVVLLKTRTEFFGAPFRNGAFVRAHNMKGEQVRNGFFAYEDGIPGDSQVMKADFDGDKTKEILTNGNGEIRISKLGRIESSFFPFARGFKKETNFAVTDFNKDALTEIVVAPGAGGGPQVRIFSVKGKLLSGGFFAYDRNFRGGVSVAAGDLNGDGKSEIVTAPGAGMEPLVKIFKQDGKLLKQFFAYDRNFRGGVSVAAGDLNGDGRSEIVTAPGAGGGPQVKIFNQDGVMLGQFFAYEKGFKSGVKVATARLTGEASEQILVMTDNLIDL